VLVASHVLGALKGGVQAVGDAQDAAGPGVGAPGGEGEEEANGWPDAGSTRSGEGGVSARG